MVEPLLIEYRWTEQDLQDSLRYHSRGATRPFFRVAFFILSAFSLGLGIIGFAISLGYLKGQPHEEQGIVSLLMALGGGIGLTYPWMHRVLIRRQYSRRPDQECEIHWEVGSDKIVAKSRLESGEYLWDAVIKVIQTPNGFLLYRLENFFHWLPRRGFASDADFARFAKLARERVPEYREIS